MNMSYDEIRALSGMAGLFLFGVIFISVLFWVFRPGAKEHFEEQGKIPFNEDPDHDENN